MGAVEPEIEVCSDFDGPQVDQRFIKESKEFMCLFTELSSINYVLSSDFSYWKGDEARNKDVCQTERNGPVIAHSHSICDIEI